MSSPRSTSEWVRELAGAARALGVVSQPAGFGGWETQRQAEWAAFAVCDLQHRAGQGDRQAVDFFRLQSHHPRPPAPTVVEAPTGPVRVGLVTPGLSMGGAEIWAVSLTAAPVDGIQWAGLATESVAAEWEGARESRQRFPILSGRGSIALLARGCDVLLIWGVRADLVPGLLGDGPRPITVCVSHGACSWTQSMVAGNETWADHRAAVSESAARPFQGGAAVIWNGVDPDRAKPRKGRAATRAAWGLGPHEKAVLYLGRFSPEKRPTAVCDACAALGPQFRPVLVGSGWKEAETIAEARRLNPRAILPGPVDHPGDALAAADCFFLASPSEGFSLALTEAWLAGLPVAATAVGGIPEMEARFGRLTVPITEPLTPRQMARAVRVALGCRGRKRARRAQAVATAHLTADHMRARWGEFLVRIGRAGC